MNIFDIRYSYSVIFSFTNIFVFVFGQEFDIRVTLQMHTLTHTLSIMIWIMMWLLIWSALVFKKATYGQTNSCYYRQIFSGHFLGGNTNFWMSPLQKRTTVPVVRGRSSSWSETSVLSTWLKLSGSCLGSFHSHSGLGTQTELSECQKEVVEMSCE